jgi:ubiquinone/menaquinone biosynthesis C-methylase UbiE
VWSVLAFFYDVIVLPFFGLRDRVVSFANAKSGLKVLDVATGTGKQGFAFAKKGCDVTGVDLSEAMLKVAV